MISPSPAVLNQSDYEQSGLLDGIDDREYRIRTAQGLMIATAYFADMETLNPGPEQLREAHKLAFGTTYRDAGRCRLGRASEGPGADASMIDTEIELLQTEFREMMAAAETPQAKTAAVAFHHARLSSITPFRRGNARIARALLTMQIERELASFGGPVMDAIERNHRAYDSALHSARCDNDLAPMVGLLCRAMQIEEPDALSVPSPFRVQPAAGGPRSKAELLERSRTGEPMPFSMSRELDTPDCV